MYYIVHARLEKHDKIQGVKDQEGTRAYGWEVPDKMNGLIDIEEIQRAIIEANQTTGEITEVIYTTVKLQKLEIVDLEAFDKAESLMQPLEYTPDEEII